MTKYELLFRQFQELIETDRWYVPLFSNISALIMDSLEDLNWAGFYIMKDGILTVGPFQGKPACIHIEPGRGVCGTAVANDEALLVPDVHLFPGHIACDSASNSELVIPFHREGKAAGVLDLDSPRLNRFTEEDKTELTRLVKLLEDSVLW